MDIYFAAVFTDLVRHSAVWNRVSRDTITSAIAEYRYLSQTLASQYGRRHENFTGDGHLYLFESADVAVHFSLKLIAYWKQRRRHLTSDQAHDLPIRVGCHFGECSRMHDDDAWIGRALNIAKRVETCAEPDTLFVTQTVLDLIDLPVYLFHEVDVFELKGDYLPRRHLYRVVSVNHRALAARSEERMTAEDWFLKGAGIAGTDARELAEELLCYEKALELRADYPEAHNNFGVILKAAGDSTAAEARYLDAVRLWPQYPEAHYNLAILLEETDRPDEAAAQYRQALKCRPDYVDALLRLAGLFDKWGIGSKRIVTSKRRCDFDRALPKPTTISESSSRNTAMRKRLNRSTDRRCRSGRITLRLTTTMRCFSKGETWRRQNHTIAQH